MAFYYIDFVGYCKVEADSVEEAKERFWDYERTDEYFEIDCVEKIEED